MFLYFILTRLGLSPSDPCSIDNVKAELTSSDIRRNIALIGSIPNNVIKQVGNNPKIYVSRRRCSIERIYSCPGPDTLAATPDRCGPGQHQQTGVLSPGLSP